ncbi:glycosyltransferase involved in cell wall biosynthesis [Rhodoblastus acidophilus]|uniref:glycosyltransferase family 2 protein n=1 Tax=Rhodoblastus acidophilus TaxID=1074 RepID=UPI00222542D2|nr:glycosyltransferase [Rhodoblastus acidophilus]MCW2283841.1 glycosyltransferase involved in cell wall biosynthesis [Rhodoblastus acidophilus]MCW2332537.1 glycosyltransferase involved in cell wall biosynthesis [Rhodoblastus acidophilus]
MTCVSVIIPHRDDCENLVLCLALLERQTFRDFEIVVADNNSACGFAKVLEVCGARARVVPAPLEGAAHARNAALAAAIGPNLAFIDSDCRPAETWLERGLKTLRDGVVVAGKVEVLFANPPRPTAAEAYEAVFAFDNRRYVRQDFCLGCNMFARRADLDRVGPFRTGAPEDLDWSRRAVRLGLKLVYDDSVVVGHPARRDWPELLRKNRRVAGELHHLRRGQGALAWAFYLVALAASPFVHAIKLASSRKISGFRLKLEAIALLFRLRWRRLSWFMELLRT